MDIRSDINFTESVLFSPKSLNKVKSAKDLKLNRFLVIYPDSIQGENPDEKLWDYTLISFRTRVEALNFIRNYKNKLPRSHESSLEPIIIDMNKSR